MKGLQSSYRPGAQLILELNIICVNTRKHPDRRAELLLGLLFPWQQLCWPVTERRKLEWGEAGGSGGREEEKLGRGRGEDWTWRKAGRSTERDERERREGRGGEEETQGLPSGQGTHRCTSICMQRASWFHLLNAIHFNSQLLPQDTLNYYLINPMVLCQNVNVVRGLTPNFQ